MAVKNMAVFTINHDYIKAGTFCQKGMIAKNKAGNM